MFQVDNLPTAPASRRLRYLDQLDAHRWLMRGYQIAPRVCNVKQI